MKIILFDGVCNLCNSTVKFIINKDSNSLFKFSSLQSEFGTKYINEHNINIKKLSTIVLIEDNQFYTKSTAILRVLKNLKGYKWMRVFLFVPKFTRDFVYNLISKNRYSLFGKNDSCMIPTKELSEKFIK
jgi:predicted DCC family thiol-disulfide oxidoreductase YuxK